MRVVCGAGHAESGHCQCHECAWHLVLVSWHLWPPAISSFKLDFLEQEEILEYQEGTECVKIGTKAESFSLLP